MPNNTHRRSPTSIALLIAALAAAFILAGCNRKPEHPDVKDAVNTAMTRNSLGVVNVSQDREKGVITLTGDVETPDQKSQAESVAAAAAPGYAIANEIGVRPIGDESRAMSVDSSLDDGIESNFKVELKSHRNLDDQSITYGAKNGTLVLKGSVKTIAQKNEANKLAQSLPNVKEVVNEIEVKSDKDSTAK